MPWPDLHRSGGIRPRSHGSRRSAFVHCRARGRQHRGTCAWCCDAAQRWRDLQPVWRLRHRRGSYPAGWGAGLGRRPPASAAHGPALSRLRPRRDPRAAARQRAGFRRARDRATRGGHRPRQPVSRRSVAQARRSRPARHHRRRGRWRQRAGLSGPYRGDGGTLARLGGGGAVLRGPLQPVHQPDPPAWQCTAEAAFSARPDRR